MFNIKNIVLGIAIIILTIFVSVYGISTFVSKPDYNDFCSDVRYPQQISEEDNTKICPAVCVPMYEIKEVRCVTEPCNPVCEFNECGSGCGPDGINSFNTLDQCELTLTGKNCYDEYDDAMKKYSKTVFIIAIPLGVLIIFLGAFFFSLDAVGAGLMGGGVGTLIYGAGGYWRYASDWLRFLLSLVGLVALIWIAYWFNKRAERKSKKEDKGKRRKRRR